MRRVVMRLAVLVILVQATAIPVPRFLNMAVDADAAGEPSTCCRPLGQCCPMTAEAPCRTNEAADDQLSPIACCIICHCGMGLISPVPNLPPAPVVASLTFLPGPSLRSIDSEPFAPPPESSMSV